MSMCVVKMEVNMKAFLENKRKIKVADWNEFLGNTLFNLDNKDTRINENIKFRTLFPYFARKATDGGFLEASKYFKNQKVFSYTDSTNIFTWT